MSLLMQALKKAERAKQNTLSDDELDKPSEAFDEILALTPEPVQPAAVAPPAPKREFNLDALSLEPMAGAAAAPAASGEARPSPSPLPAASDHREPGLTLDFAPDPSDPVNAAAAAAPADDAGAGPAPAAATPRSAAPTAAAATAAASAAKPATAGSGPQAGAGARSSAAPAGGDQPRAAARARARAAATAEPAGIDPERLRLIGLIAVVVLLVGGFGIYYWRALSGPGAGASLPPVPMPPPGATGATPAQVVVAALGPGAAPPAAPAAPADSDDPMLAPSGVSRSAQQALEQRIAKTEQELAAARAAIEATQAAAAAPRAEQMPPLAAPDNGEIRVARSMQASPVAPALDSAYNAFNSGDLAAAEQQYDAALKQDPNNRDALLGAAAVAVRQGRKDQAAAFYLRLLELSPNDGAATAGLIGLRQGDISRSEARLRAILATNPEAAPVLFALGNLYAQQGRWPDAQQAYFRAVGAAPDNPDYAYNLAIGLDRLNQPRLAIGYYQRALALAQDKAVGFDRNALRKRLHELNAGRAAH